MNYKTFFLSILILAEMIGCGSKSDAPVKAQAPSKDTIAASFPSTSVMIPRFTDTFIKNIRIKKFVSTPIIVDSVMEDSASWKIERVHYTSEGVKITALLGMPKKTALPLPAVLICHGYYPPRDYFQGQGTLSTIEGLCSEGFAVLVPDYRGYGGSGGGHQTNVPGEEYDVINAYNALKMRKDVAGDKIFLVGYSWGGGFAARAAEVIPDAAGLVNYYGQLGGIRPHPRQAVFFRSYGAADDEIKYIFDKQSPIHNASYVNSPVLLIHGEKDTTVLPEQSEAFYSALKKEGKDVIYRTFPEYAHAFGDNYSNSATPVLLEFLKKHSQK